METVVDLLIQRAAHHPSRQGFVLLEDGERKGATLTYAELAAGASQTGAQITRFCAPGDRVLLAYPSGLEFITAFLGCLVAGVIPVPVPPLELPLSRTLPHLGAIGQSSGARHVLCTSRLTELHQKAMVLEPHLAAWTWHFTDTWPKAAGRAEISRKHLAPSAPAYLQYTSGSTGEPRGVMLSHENLFGHAEAIRQRFALGEDDCGMTWTPLFHSMGLFAGVLQPLLLNFPSIIMSPYDFLKHPHRWLNAISEWGATYSGGPNFAYDLAVRRITPEQAAGLDLRKWRVAYLAAEPIRASTLRRFCQRFSAQGFREQAYAPGYGLSEATTRVSAHAPGRSPTVLRLSPTALEQQQVSVSEAGDTFVEVVSCGAPLPQIELKIVDPVTATPAAVQSVGEIWVAGPTVAPGYWQDSEHTAQTFRAHLASHANTAENRMAYLRTGDLGFLHHSELFVTGRHKELIIIRGRNYYPQQIEVCVEQSHPSLRPGCSAAFAIDHENEERLVVVTELERRHLLERRKDPTQPGRRRSGEERRQRDMDPGFEPEQPTAVDMTAVDRAIRRAIHSQFMLRPHAILLIQAGRLPKTVNRKVRRIACRTAFLGGTLLPVSL